MHRSDQAAWAEGMSPALRVVVFDTLEKRLMAEIRVAPQRRNRAIGWIAIALLLAAAAAWYFLAGPTF